MFYLVKHLALNSKMKRKGESGRDGFETRLYHFLAVWLWQGPLTTMSLSFLIFIDRLLTKLNILIPYDSAIVLLGTYKKELKA